MTETQAYWREQIRQILPDLTITKFELHREGLVNDILIVNDEWVIRFTKTEWGQELMDLEARLLRFLAPRLTLSIPSPMKRDDSVLVYPHLHGQTFAREIWAEADRERQQAIADQLGQFLSELHEAPVNDLDWEMPHTLAPVTRESWLDIHERFNEQVLPLLLPHQIDWVETLFETALGKPDFFEYDPVLIHGDLAPYHILFSKAEMQLTGVIDFGVAGMGDPATDFGNLISSYGETLVSKLERSYPGLDVLLPRARFYAHAIELQWVLLGIESGEKYWFTAHLGGARDIF